MRAAVGVIGHRGRLRGPDRVEIVVPHHVSGAHVRPTVEKRAAGRTRATRHQGLVLRPLLLKQHLLWMHRVGVKRLHRRAEVKRVPGAATARSVVLLLLRATHSAW